MRLYRMQIHNFRNFRDLDVEFGQHAVIVGGNKIGKSNLLYALRLILDPALPDTARTLQFADFWDGIPRPFAEPPSISISVDVSDFAHDDALLAVLGQYLISLDPMIARLTYDFRIIDTNAPLDRISSYSFVLYGGDRPDQTFGYELRRHIPLEVLPALRDAESDLATARRSPLQPLLMRAVEHVDRDTLESIVANVVAAHRELGSLPPIAELATTIGERLVQMVGDWHATSIDLAPTPSSAEQLIRAIRILIDNARRGIGDASLGTSNVLYIALKLLEIEQLTEIGSRQHTFLAIEEPEAHLHPHVQRMAYSDVLQRRIGSVGVNPAVDRRQTVILTTHSPHIVSVTPLRSLILLRQTRDTMATEAVSAANLDLTPKEVDDIERFLDVTRGELIFARGVILVEGEAEAYLVPEFARLRGQDLDRYGISVCSIAGVHFGVYIKLLGERGLSIPWVVLTDGDPEVQMTGVQRVNQLLELLMSPEDYASLNLEERVARASSYGIYLNASTLEIELLANSPESVLETLEELGTSAVRRRVALWRAAPTDEMATQLLKDIGAIGKGRFAQRLASRIDPVRCPSYIQQAIGHIINVVLPASDLP